MGACEGEGQEVKDLLLIAQGFLQRIAVVLLLSAHGLVGELLVQLRAGLRVRLVLGEQSQRKRASHQETSWLKLGRAKADNL